MLAKKKTFQKGVPWQGQIFMNTRDVLWRSMKYTLGRSSFKGMKFGAFIRQIRHEEFWRKPKTSTQTLLEDLLGE